MNFYVGFEGNADHNSHQFTAQLKRLGFDLVTEPVSDSTVAPIMNARWFLLVSNANFKNLSAYQRDLVNGKCFCFEQSARRGFCEFYDSGSASALCTMNLDFATSDPETRGHARLYMADAKSVLAVGQGSIRS